MKFILLFLIAAMIEQVSANPSCSLKGTSVFYTNGVIASRIEADNTVIQIGELKVDSQIDVNPRMVVYKLAYNFSESIAKDFVEAAIQRFPTRFLKEYAIKDRYAAYSLYLNGKMNTPAYSNEFNSISEAVLDVLEVWIREHANFTQYTKTVSEIHELYEDALNRGERVFAISHSQGGLFMRDAYALINFRDKEKYFSSFQVATPINGSFGKHFGYATHDKDRLINGLRFLFGSLDHNISTDGWVVSNDFTKIKDYIIDFVLNHGMASTYLYDEGIKREVVKKMIETAQKLESNCPALFRARINYQPKGLWVTFDATDPEDPNITGLTYEWDFGNGDMLVTDKKRINYQYSEEGYYEVSLKVKDGTGATRRDYAELSLQYSEYTFFLPIEPRGTYLFTDCSDLNPYGADCALPATSLDLTSLYNDPNVNLREGDMISILVDGGRPWYPGTMGGYDQLIMTVFEGDSGFLFPGPNSVAAEAISHPTYGRNLATDIPEDRFVNFDTLYDVTPTLLQIPYGAKRLKFSLNDHHFKDNIDPLGNTLKAWIKITIIRGSQPQLD